MDTSLNRARGGPTSAKVRQGLTDAKLRDLPPRERAYKVSDGGNGLYVVIVCHLLLLPTGAVDHVAKRKKYRHVCLTCRPRRHTVPTCRQSSAFAS